MLVVEDEFLVGLQLEEILTEAGHEVIGIASDRASVVEVDRDPDIALVDLNLRDGPSGPGIAWLLAQKHGTAIIYVTANPVQIRRPAPTTVGVIQKPFSPGCILAAVELALHQPGERGRVPQCEIYSLPHGGEVLASGGEKPDAMLGQPKPSVFSVRSLMLPTSRAR